MKYSELIQSLKNECYSLNLLYVEDDIELCDNTYNILKPFFKSVSIANNGEDGLNIYKNGLFDIVLTDILMPKMDGREMSRIIRSINSRQVIIIMSAHEDSEYFLELIDIGIHKFIPKPPSLTHLFRAITEAAIDINNAKKVAKLSKEMKEDLRDSKDLLRNIIETIPVRIFWKDINSIYLGCNTLFANDAGAKSQNEIIGKRDLDLSWSNQAEDYVADDFYVINTKKEKINIEEKQTKADGKIVWLSTSKVPLKSENGKVVGILGIYFDITERKNAQNELVGYKDKLEGLVSVRTEELERSIVELTNAQKQLIESEKMASLGSLVAGVAHEINTPVGVSLTGITHIQTLTETINKSFSDGSIKQSSLRSYIDDVTKLSESMRLSLVSAAELIKSFKKVAVDQNTEQKRVFHLQDYIDDVLLSLNNILKKTNIKIDNLISDDLIINSYPGIFSQIMTNLITNSVIHAYDENEDGLIEIDARKTDDTVELIYKDNGKGMNEHTAKHIYDPFFTTNMGQGGSGLGMNIVFNLITQKLKGTIVCNSKENVGTDFSVIIPCEESN